MLINWRDMLSMISSPDPLLLLPGVHLVSVFLQQVGPGRGMVFFFLSEAEEVKTMAARVSTRTNAVVISRVLFFMVVGLEV